MSPKIGMEPIRRQQIIEAAKHCIVTKGLPHFSIKDIAKAANLSTGVIYHYFENKDDLLVDVLKDSFSNTEKLVKETVDAASNYNNKMKAYLETVAKVPDENPDFYIILLNYLAQAPYNEELKRIISRFFQNLGRFIEGILQIGYKEGVIKKIEKGTAANLILSQAMGLAFYYLISNEKINKDKINRDFVEIFKKYIE
ncbi:TetR/AcrR family transcriptional regulator [Anaerobacillus isosaccharinicus]|uniref:TetR/AcrR family transcriptional regulator n=1 Tax=Anaerobacillus isosaccharinicus TaxID=1532552 RepID=A0A1S2KY86_9BACI|nr:TetR/AcrR family transcriptional regulator [Anaerobacillus isosaccharinicus]MBA5584312.1 TetR/AcrR family transcriptional regulator [Anaerobacillus isosaccharinicus]QOY37290.1 TetR/AcrR family transcriptional regulator [Anaerobacillus isosaccharinicus]